MYPAITDGLALVAHGVTARLSTATSAGTPPLASCFPGVGVRLGWWFSTQQVPTAAATWATL